MLTESCSKVASKFNCKKCDYNTSKKSSYDKHLTTSKHSQLTTVNTFGTQSCQNITNCNTFICDNCSKEYKSRVGLWKHYKICSKSNIEIQKDETFDKDELIMMIIKQNSELIKETSEFKNMMMKVIENGTTNNTTNNINSHNKAFNLNFFFERNM